MSRARGDHPPAARLGSGPRQSGRALLWTVLCLGALSVLGVYLGFRLRREKQSRQGFLEVRSGPSPAEVRLDGRFVGLTPRRMENVATGEHLVKVRLQGYRPHAQRCQVASPGRRLNVQMEKTATGALAVKSKPDGAEVILDGQSRGNTPLEVEGLAPGSYHLVLRRAGHEFWSREVVVKGGGRAEVRGEMENSVLKFLNAAVLANPKDLHYWTELGHYLGCHDMIDESVAAFREGLELCMNSKPPPKEIRRHFQMLARQMARRVGRRNRAEYRRKASEMFAEIARKHAREPQAIGRLARMLETQRRPADALRLYVGACRATKGADARLATRGFAVALRVKRLPEAEEILGMARKMRPTDYLMRQEMAKACLTGYSRFTGAPQRKVLGLAEELYAEVAKLTVKRSVRAQAHYGAARAQSFAKEHAKAVASYRRAAEELLAAKGSRRKWAEWQFERANLLVKLGKTAEARALLEKIVKEAAKTPAAGRARKELERLASSAKPPEKK